MCAGADCIDDVDIVRAGGMKTLFDDGVRAVDGRNPVAGVHLRACPPTGIRPAWHLAALCERAELLPGADERAFVDIDSLLRPVYGHAKEGATYGHTKMPGNRSCAKGCRRW